MIFFYVYTYLCISIKKLDEIQKELKFVRSPINVKKKKKKEEKWTNKKNERLIV